MNSLAHAVSQISCHNPVSPPGDHMYYNNPTPAPDNIIHIPVHTESIQPTVHTESIQPTVPLWKQQLLEQKARKHSQEKQQVGQGRFSVNLANVRTEWFMGMKHINLIRW